MFYKQFVKKIGLRKDLDEAYVSAEQTAPFPDAWFSDPHEHPGRPPGFEAPPQQGPQAFVGVSRPGSPAAPPNH
jgi:hypothetical protein